MNETADPQNNQAASDAGLPRQEFNPFMRSIVNALQEAVVAVDMKGKVISWNKAAEQLYGVEAGDATGKPLNTLNVPEAIKQVLHSIEQIKNGHIAQEHHAIQLSRNGHNVTAELDVFVIKEHNGSIAGVAAVARDVTTLRQLEASASVSNNRFRTITDTVPQIIWENDTSGKAIYFNERFLAYSGLSTEDLTGPGWQVIVHPDDHAATEKWSEALWQTAVFESEIRLRRFDGVYLWHLLRNVPLKDDANRVVGWFGSATNINELKIAQIQLNETTERLRTTLETAMDFAIITMDKYGFIIDWNSGAERMFGYNKADAIGQYGDIIFTPEDRYGNIPSVEFTTAREKGRSIDERWHLRKDGTRFFMSGVMLPVEKNIQAGFVKVARDITDRKIAEEALLQSEQRRSMAVETAKMGEWEWDIPSDTVTRSEQAAYLLGLQNDGIPKHASSFFTSVYQDDLAMVRTQMQTALEGLNVFQAEYRINRADNGQVRWMNVYGRIISHEGTKPLKMIGVMYDITDRKALEKEKDDFINVASHELKTPVTTIKAYSDILEEVLSDSNQRESAELVKKLNGQVDRLVKLIYDLLDMKTLSEGKMRIRPEVFDLNELITEQVEEMKLIAARHALIWKPAPVPLIHADRNRIRQVLVNLISNAIAYSSEESEITISAVDKMDSVLVSVKDAGIGIPPEEHARVFQRYYRAGNRELSNHPGLGLGLYICSEIIKQHYGTIGVDSLPGQGSTFYFKLPYS